MFSQKSVLIVLTAAFALTLLVLNVVLLKKVDMLQAEIPLLQDNHSSCSTNKSADNISSSSSDKKTGKKGYNKEYYTENITYYDSVILPYNPDKEENYLEETLFIGDSNTAGLSCYGHMPMQNVLGKPSMAIQAADSEAFVWFKGYSNAVTIPKAVKLLKPRRIIVNFGTNNTIGTSAEDFKRIYSSVLKNIEQSYPYCDIIVAAVLPVGYYRENYNITQYTVDCFNLSLAEMCLENGYKFLDYSQCFKDNESGYMDSSCVATDGIHLNSKGFKMLLEYVNDHQYSTKDRRPDVKNIPIVTTAPAQQTSVSVVSEAKSTFSSSQNEDEAVSSDSCDEKKQNSTDIAENKIITDNTISGEKIIYDPLI